MKGIIGIKVGTVYGVSGLSDSRVPASQSNCLGGSERRVITVAFLKTAYRNVFCQDFTLFWCWGILRFETPPVSAAITLTDVLHHPSSTTLRRLCEEHKPPHLLAETPLPLEKTHTRCVAG